MLLRKEVIMKRSIALLLALASLLTLFALVGCEEKDDKKRGSDGMYIRQTCTDRTILEYRAIYEETGCKPIDFDKLPEKVDDAYPNVKINVYYAVGFDNYRVITDEEYASIQKYQNETGRQVIYPTVSYFDREYFPEKYKYDANIYYLTETKKVVRPSFDENGKFIPNYWTYEAGNQPTVAAEYNSLRIEGADGFVGEDGKTYYYAYGRILPDGVVEVRLFMYEYYLYIKKTHPESSDTIKRIFERYSVEFN